MSTQQDIHAAGSESHHPMPNKENYVPWSSRLLRYAKSRLNGKLIHNSILNGQYVRRMIPEPGDANREVTTILLGLPEDIYAAVDSCETAQEIWFTSNEGESIECYYHRFLKLMNDLKRNKHFPEKIASNLKYLNNLQPEWSRHVTIVHQTKDLNTADYTQLYDFLKYNQKEVDELKAKRLSKTQDPLALMANSNNPYAFLAPHQDQSSFNQNYLQQSMPNPEDITDPTTATNMALALMAKAFKLNYSTPTNNNQRISSNPKNSKHRPRVLRLTALPSMIQTDQLRMTIETHNWSSSAHQELHKIIRDEIFSIINQVDAIVQNFKIQFLKEAAKFVGDFKSLTNEADASLAKHKALELEIKRLLKAVVSQDIMIIVQNEYVVDISDLQTELEPYKDMQQKIKRLQAQLGDLKGKSKDTSCVSDTRNPLSWKLENENVELEFQVLNYARENAHLKATYKNLFDSISVSRTQTKTIIASLQNKLQSTIYKNAKLKTQLFKKVSNQKDNTQATSENTKFAKQPIVENLSKVGQTNAFSKPVTSNSVSTPQESKGVNNDKVIALGMFRINLFKTSKDEKHVPNTVRASDKKKPITVSQPLVITKKYV
nr:hypothetical protein [Tanacetum cinerariifolium]